MQNIDIVLKGKGKIKLQLVDILLEKTIYSQTSELTSDISIVSCDKFDLEGCNLHTALEFRANVLEGEGISIRSAEFKM